MTIHKLKSIAASIPVPQSHIDVQTAISSLGNVSRQLTRVEADMNDAIARITEAQAEKIEALRQHRAALQTGIQTWCEAHRLQICGKNKYADLVTGEVAWRQRPPSVTVRNADAVINQLGELGLTQFVRVKHEINKEAILAAPEQVQGIKGLQVSTGVEDFVITPFEVAFDQERA